MKITIDQSLLLNELSLLQGIIEKKATLPILSNVLLTATEDGRLSLAATDLEIGFRSSATATVEAPGSTTVHARRLHDIVRRLPPGSLGFRLDDGFLHLNTERIRYKLATMEPDEFPSLRQKEGSAQGGVPVHALADMIRRVVFAISGEDPRYSIGGALWELGDETLTMVATDGHRLSLSRRPAKAAKGASKMVVPRKALSEMLRLAQDHDGDADLWSSPTTLFAAMGDREINTSLQEPKFPDYGRVIPKDNDKAFVIDREALRDAIQRVAVLSQEHTHLIKVELDDGLLRLSATSPHLGEAQEELAIDYSGESFAIGFNAQYLLDFLAVAGTEKVRLSLGREMGQGLFEPVRDDDAKGEDIYVVMPMAL